MLKTTLLPETRLDAVHQLSRVSKPYYLDRACVCCSAQFRLARLGSFVTRAYPPLTRKDSTCSSSWHSSPALATSTQVE